MPFDRRRPDMVLRVLRNTPGSGQPVLAVVLVAVMAMVAAIWAVDRTATETVVVDQAPDAAGAVSDATMSRTAAHKPAGNWATGRSTPFAGDSTSAPSTSPPPASGTGRHAGSAAAAPTAASEGTRPKAPVGGETPGVTDDTIYLGFQYINTEAFNAAAAGLGLSGTFPDTGPARDAVIEYLNKRGGIAGRRIEKVMYEILAADAVSQEGRARSAQEACSTYAEDNEVFAFGGGSAFTEDNVNQCAADHQMVFVQGGFNGAMVSERRYQQIAPYVLMPSRFLVEARDRHYVDRLVTEGLLPSDAQVGLLVEDEAAAHEGVDHVLKPALQGHGIEVAAEAAYPDVIESPWETYVLQFRSAGVTHVLFSSSSYGFWPTQMFTRAAENQQWRPGYGLSTEQWASGQADQGPPQQLPQMAGVGWWPGADVGEAAEVEVTPRCKEAVAEAGLPEEDEPLAAGTCDFLFTLHDGLANAPEVSATALMDGLLQVETPRSSSTGNPIKWRLGRPDGVTRLRPFAWDTNCECFRYLDDGVLVD